MSRRIRTRPWLACLAAVLASATGSVTGTSLTKLVVANYYGTGVQSIDNFRLGTSNGSLKGKTAYAFGDSTVAGHKCARGFVNLTADRELMALIKHARNGATIGTSDLQILAQVKGAATWGVKVADVFNDTTRDTRADSGGWPTRSTTSPSPTRAPVWHRHPAGAETPPSS